MGKLGVLRLSKEHIGFFHASMASIDRGSQDRIGELDEVTRPRQDAPSEVATSCDLMHGGTEVVTPKGLRCRADASEGDVPLLDYSYEKLWVVPFEANDGQFVWLLRCD
jgi:hypothetical protein